MREAIEATGSFWYTYEEAVKASKDYSKNCSPVGSFYGMYCSIVKGEPNDPNRPEECWAVTNRYDQRVARSN